MDRFDPKTHWESVYGAKAENEVSWFQAEPAASLDLIRRSSASVDTPVIDIGGGESRLVDRLLEAGYSDVTVLDLSEQALRHTQARLGARAGAVRWIVADITRWRAERRYGVWHDRAALHFLTDAQDRADYRRALLDAVTPGGCVVIATFALDGPEKCSGLPVVRYSSETLAAELGPELKLEETHDEKHRTPWGAVQRFQFSRFTRL